MKKEDKDLLLKDLCARLPYNVIINCTDSDTNYNCFLTTDILYELLHNIEYYDYKPYLRSMSSMTEEERNNLRAYCRTQEGIIYDIGVAGAINCLAIIDFLNKNHFDYRGLIEKGLAIEASKDMYNIK